MPFSPCPRFSQGYSLTELAIVLAIIGLVSGLTVSTGKVHLSVVEIQGTKARLDIVRSALQLFQKKHKRYPCPARPGDGTASASYGLEVNAVIGCDAACPAGLTCDNSAVIGAVPFKTLKLNEEVAYDSWDGKIDYIVDKTHTRNSDYGTGSLPIIDSHGNEVTGSPVFGDAIFVLVSHGKDGKGAYGKSGGLVTACGATGKDIENCNGDDAFMDSRFNMGDVPASYFDDLLVWQTQENVSPAPPPFSSPFDIGDFNGCAMKATNTVWCWGLNDGGQLGDGTTTDRSSPVQVSGLTNAVQIASNSWHSCAVKTDGTAWCWGWNPDGRLGDGTTTNRSVPVQVSGLANVSQIDTGDFHTCAVKTDGTVWCWGLNHDMWFNTGGQIGNGAWGDNPLTPVQVTGGFSNVKQVTTGYLHTCAVKTDGTAWCWGSNHKPDRSIYRGL